MRTDRYTLEIVFDVEEGKILPAGLLAGMADSDVLAAAIAFIEGGEDTAEHALRVSGTIYGPEPSNI